MYFSFKQYILFELFILVYANYLKSKDSDAKNDSKEYTVCKTKACIDAAKHVKSLINEKVNPCENFYQFACGRFVAYVGVKDDSYAPNDMAEIVTDKVALQLKEILENPINSHDIRPFRLAKKLYRLCMEEGKFGLKHMELVNKYLQIFGGWPVLEGSSWDERTFNWIELIKQFIKYGFNDDSIISIVRGVNFTNASQKIIDIDQPDLAFEREYLTNFHRGKSVLSAYYDYMLEVVTSLGAEKDVAVVDLKAALEFEIKIAKITSSMEKHHNIGKQNNPFTLASLAKKYPYVPWEDLLTLYTKRNVSATPDLLINVSKPRYYRKLGNLLKRTKKRVLANYLIWRAISEFIQMLPSISFQSQLDLLRELTGRDMIAPKYESCVDVVSDGLDIAIGAIYARKYFNNTAKKMVTEITERIRREMMNVLLNVKWMDEKTRAYALEKAEAMEFHVAYPDELSQDKNIEEFYKMLELPDNYLLSTLTLNKFDCNTTFDQLVTPYNRSDWTLHSSVHEVNACYTPQENSVDIPAALLQEVYFEKDRPMYMNYGGIGSVIAHEVTHGFDKDGRFFDLNGNRFKWWDKESRKSYDAKAWRMRKHYSKYTVPDVSMKLDGRLVHGESIADHGALKVSYKAYKGWVADNGEEPRLPSLEKYTPLQMFWISNAHTWCTRVIKQELELQIISDYHAPSEFRVNVPMRNSKQFTKDFKCSIGSFMNPAKRVKVW